MKILNIEVRHTIPNDLSLYRMVAGLIIAVLFLTMSQGIVFEVTWVAIYVIACLTDWADGHIAKRWLSEASDFGKIIDPLADKVLVISMVTLVLFVGKVELLSFESFLMALIVAREVLISIARKPLIGDVNILSVSKIGRWKAAVQMIAVGVLLGRDGIIAGLFGRMVPHLSFEYFGSLLLLTATILTLYSGYGYFVRWINTSGATTT